MKYEGLAELVFVLKYNLLKLFRKEENTILSLNLKLNIFATFVFNSEKKFLDLRILKLQKFALYLSAKVPLPNPENRKCTL